MKDSIMIQERCRKCSFRRRSLLSSQKLNLAILLIVFVICITASSKSRCESRGGVIFFASAITVSLAKPSGQEKEENDDLRIRGGGSPGNNAAVIATKKPNNQTLSAILYKAGKRGIGGGIPGAIAGAVQVFCLMWLRTIINYQYRYGTTIRQAVGTLLNEGGIQRFYRGVGFALIQAPLSRFVSTAANDGVEAFLSDLERTKTWGPGRCTAVASIVVGVFRMLLMPIDTCKTVLQVDSTEGFRSLMRKVRAGKVVLLYQGSIANALSAVVSHYPWFYTYNILSKNNILGNWIQKPLLKNAAIGFMASLISDTFTNSIRVIKTTKQSIASKHTVGYQETINMILATDGWKGLFGRGLKARLLSNGLQSIVFIVIWRSLSERWSKHENEEESIDGADA
mmetsp:Transcript_34885/g.42091  ORF Transcript_34885/g.42091 Transcript_34885/m.42091 type:complete len:397 (+) Transcript_34885:134-1324(+)|eukprot:CAMPEP_0194356420 /NCGR_PEP_ID=MMETSP0174-20130528/4076_1 /TAXON_ID=216777 /ORGANISM="Proboscia alata, Strain PI-D3" /LENGTH=396 /DNA_ID=CAMNT_0039126009 /DNA_START=223 /DNA_END=1413 /DNA_ORIENTATION=+